MKCTRCEVLGRKQQSDELHYIGGCTPICSVCLKEVTEEDLFFIDLEYEQGSESTIEEDS